MKNGGIVSATHTESLPEKSTQVQDNSKERKKESSAECRHLRRSIAEWRQKETRSPETWPGSVDGSFPPRPRGLLVWMLDSTSLPRAACAVIGTIAVDSFQKMRDIKLHPPTRTVDGMIASLSNEKKGNLSSEANHTPPNSQGCQRDGCQLVRSGISPVHVGMPTINGTEQPVLSVRSMIAARRRSSSRSYTTAQPGLSVG